MWRSLKLPRTARPAFGLINLGMGIAVGLYPVFLDDTWSGQLALENRSQEFRISGILTQAIAKLGSERKRTENDV